MRRRKLLPSLSAALLALAPFAAQADSAPAQPALGLMGTVPIYWGEADGIGDILSGKGEPHWARAALEKRFTLTPLSYLDDAALAPFANLVLAQPRALSGEENVALDEWVRAGGHLLLFADPMMTGHSRYAIGDRRRPQDMVMLSPILGHWGLRLELLDEQPEGRATVDAFGVPLPVEIPGRFVPTRDEGMCELSATAVVARCRIGAGTATIVADAAAIDMDAQSDSAKALEALIELAFGKIGEIPGKVGSDSLR